MGFPLAFPVLKFVGTGRLRVDVIHDTDFVHNKIGNDKVGDLSGVTIKTVTIKTVTIKTVTI